MNGIHFLIVMKLDLLLAQYSWFTVIADHSLGSSEINHLKNIASRGILRFLAS